MPIGTFINAAAVVIGSLIGLLLHKNFPPKLKLIVFQVLGLSTLVIGMQMAFKAEDLLILIFSAIIGGIIGELINLEKYFEKISEFLKSKVKSKNERFTEGLVTAFVLYCIGSMTLVGTLNEGLTGDRTLLLTKSVLDGFTSIAFASTYGAGVLYSAIPLLIFQSALTLLASQSQGILTGIMINQISAMGGILILGTSLNMLDIKKIKVTNMIPALIVIAILTAIFY